MALDVAGRAEVVVRAHLTHDRLQRLVFVLNDDVDGPQRRRHDCWDRIRTIPGITAMQAAASAANLTLVEGSEPLTLLPLARDLATLDDALARGGTLVAYKSGRRLAQTDAAAYLSTVVVLPPRTGRGDQL